MGEDRLTTADQDAWVELAQAVRAQLMKRVELMPAMSPDEVKTFVESVQKALCLELNAATFDKDIELMQARPTWGD